MTAYTITVINQSATDRSYFAFTQPAPLIASGSLAQAAGTNADNLVASAWQQPVYMQAAHTVHEVEPPVPIAPGEIFDFVAPAPAPAPVSLGSAPVGSFSIMTGTDFIPNNNYVFGLARAGGSPIPSPVATFKVQPNDKLNATPVEKFYVSDGAFTPGDVIDVTTTSNGYATIDFTGRPETNATVIQAADGSFSVTYG